MRGLRGIVTALLVLGGHTACNQEVDLGDDGGDVDGDAPASLSVRVTFEGSSRDVSLGSIALVDFEGTAMVRVSDVIVAAFPAADHASLAAGFIAADGFRPESQDFCIGLIPVAWDHLSRGYIDPATLRLFWDTALGWPGCMSPRDLAVIEVVRP